MFERLVSGLTRSADPVAEPPVQRSTQGRHLVQEVLSQPGTPIEHALRLRFGSQFGFDFSAVRIHNDKSAAESASLLNAKAYTVGRHIVLGSGERVDGGSGGARLLAHELAHVVQQRAATPTAGELPIASPQHEQEAHRATDAVMANKAVSLSSHSSLSIGRQASDEDKDSLERRTGVKVELGPLNPGLLNSKVPMPASLSMRKAPASGQGGWLTAPSFTLHLDPSILVGGVLDQLDLGGFSLVNPTLVVNRKTDTLAAVATVQIPTDYPSVSTPTNISIRITSSKLDRFDIQGVYGPFVADFTLSLSYDSAPLERLRKGVLSGDLWSSLGQLGSIPTQGKLKLSGSAGVGTTKHKLPLAGAIASGDVGPKGAQFRGFGGGFIGLPKGTFRPDLAFPAVGVTGIRGNVEPSGASSRQFGFVGVTGAPSLEAISSLDFGGMIKPFAYSQITMAHRSADGHVLGIRVSAEFDVAGPKTLSVTEQMRQDAYDDRQRQRYNTDSRDSKQLDIDPSVRSQWAGMQGGGPEAKLSSNLVIFGSFDLFGSK